MLPVYIMCLYICRFVEDCVNFGINTDDPGIIGTTLNHEFEFAVTKLELTNDQLITSVFHAMRSSFLPPEKKDELMDQLRRRIDDYKKSN